MKKRLLASLLSGVVASGLVGISSVALETTRSEWKAVDAKGHFSFAIPPDMEERTVQGTDSYVGEYRNDGIQLSFDYGAYSDPLRYSREPDYEESTAEIDGKQAKVVTFRRTKPQDGFLYVAAVHFADLGLPSTVVGMVTKLTMWARCNEPSNQEIAKAIFQSLKFPISQRR